MAAYAFLKLPVHFSLPRRWESETQLAVEQVCRLRNPQRQTLVEAARPCSAQIAQEFAATLENCCRRLLECLNRSAKTRSSQKSDVAGTSRARVQILGMLLAAYREHGNDVTSLCNLCCNPHLLVMWAAGHPFLKRPTPVAAGRSV